MQIRITCIRCCVLYFIILHFMARFSCHEYHMVPSSHEYRLCFKPNTFKLSFSVYGFQVIEAYSNLVRHCFDFQILFPG